MQLQCFVELAVDVRNPGIMKAIYFDITFVSLRGAGNYYYFH